METLGKEKSGEEEAQRQEQAALRSVLEVDFPEIDIETTVTVLLHRFHAGKISLPLEVEMCPIGFEREGWRAAARRVLKEAQAKKH